jgi:hypothetical protein
VALVIYMGDTPNHYIGYCGIGIGVGPRFGIPSNLNNIYEVVVGNTPPRRDVGPSKGNRWWVQMLVLLLELWACKYQEAVALMLLELLT